MRGVSPLFLDVCWFEIIRFSKLSVWLGGPGGASQEKSMSVGSTAVVFSFVCPAIRPSIRSFVCPSVCPSIRRHPAVRPYVRPFVRHPAVRPAVRPSIRLFINVRVSASPHPYEFVQVKLVKQ